MDRNLNLSNLKNHPQNLYAEAISSQIDILKKHFTFAQLDTALDTLASRFSKIKTEITIQKTSLIITIRQKKMRSSNRTTPFTEKRSYFCLSSRNSGLFWFGDKPLKGKETPKNEITELFARSLGFESYERFLRTDDSLNEVVYDLIVNSLFLNALIKKAQEEKR